ncbi:MAG: endo-1,4-beta-xylanase [Alphaproteobacteria bacterium]
MKTISRRAALGGLASLAPALAFAQTQLPLRCLAQRRGCLFGCAAATYQLKDSGLAKALARDAGILVAEYEMKRKSIERVRGHFDFHAGDALRAFAKANGMAFRGHTLVWHRANPAWLEEAVAKGDERLLTGYIDTVVRHYAGLHSWDVVNEVVEPKDGRPDGLRNTLWLARFGPAYVELAFRAARAADENAILVLNEYGLETEAPGNDLRRHFTLRLLERLRSRAVPVDALGLQAHLRVSGAPIDRKRFSRFLREVRALGVRVMVTEHDVIGKSTKPTRHFVETVMEADPIAIITWGLSQKFAGRGMLLPLDAALAPTPMYGEIAAAFTA